MTVGASGSFAGQGGVTKRTRPTAVAGIRRDGRVMDISVCRPVRDDETVAMAVPAVGEFRDGISPAVVVPGRTAVLLRTGPLRPPRPQYPPAHDLRAVPVPGSVFRLRATLPFRQLAEMAVRAGTVLAAGGRGTLLRHLRRRHPRPAERRPRPADARLPARRPPPRP